MNTDNEYPVPGCFLYSLQLHFVIIKTPNGFEVLLHEEENKKNGKNLIAYDIDFSDSFFLFNR
jgi:hypothetical protein